MDRRMWYLLGFALVVGICVSAFIIAPSGEFGGSDDGGSDKIQEIDPGFEPWFNSLWVAPSETQSLLFAVQAAIGAIIIGYFIGNEHGKRVATEKFQKLNNVQTSTTKNEGPEMKTGNL